MTRNGRQKIRRRLISKMNYLQRDLQVYLKKLSIFERKHVKSIPIGDHKQVVKSFLALAKCYQTTLEEWSLADS